MYYMIASAYDGAKYPVSRMEPAAIPLKNGFKCADGEWVYISVLDHERDYPKLCRMVEREELIGDSRFNTLSAAQENCRALTEILDAEFRKKDHDQWLRLLAEYGLPCSPLPHICEVWEDPQCKANRFAERYKTRAGKTFMLPNTPVRFGDNVPAEMRPAPRFGGEDTVELLRSVGYGDDQIEALERAGAVAARHE